MNSQNHKVSLTKQGYDELVSELDQLKNDKLPKAIDRVAQARAHGDLSENSEYHSAREDLAFVEGRVEELETLIARAKIIKKSSFEAFEKQASQRIVFSLFGCRLGPDFGVF